jgi:hypothetical protein
MRVNLRSALIRASRISLFAAALAMVSAGHLRAQGAGAGARGPNNVQIAANRAPRSAAPKDLTGYWESIVTEYWRYRMVVPDKSDYVITPLNAEGRKVADAWDPAKDKADGNECKGYGAAAIMQVPGRLHVYWQDDNTLRIDTDSGTQTRLFHFGGSAPANAAPEWQGYSVASWEGMRPDSQRAGGGGPVQNANDGGAQGAVGSNAAREVGGAIPGYLKVVTTHMRPGYLRKNGVPYSANATMEEYYDRFSDPYTKETWLVVTTVVTDPQYLTEPSITHAHFKKIPDASGWDPTPCRADEAR